MLKKETLIQKITQVKRWRHKILLPGGIVTPGSQDTFSQLPTIGLPEKLTGKSVIDIGCSDGFYSFECERRGADRVLAVDNFSSVYIDSPSGFKIAHEILGSKVEYLENDLFNLDPAKVGKFDLVLFLGVLYHLRHPLLALERLGTLCQGQIILETAIIEEPGGLKKTVEKILKIAGKTSPQFLMEFYLEDEINHDPTNWWVPNSRCVEAMLRSCGFCEVRAFFSASKRGIFHAYTPRVGSDVTELIGKYGKENIVTGLRRILGCSYALAEVENVLRGTSISQFAQIKQFLAETRAKQWHQVERFKEP